MFAASRVSVVCHTSPQTSLSTAGVWLKNKARSPPPSGRDDQSTALTCPLLDQPAKPFSKDGLAILFPSMAAIKEARSTRMGLPSEVAISMPMD